MSSVDKRLIGATFGMMLLVLASCAPLPKPVPITGAGQRPQTKSELANTKWMLVTFGEPNAKRPVIKGSTITLEFDSEGQANGSGGCNAYNIQYEVKDNVLAPGEIIHTLTACEQEDIEQQELLYFQALASAGGFALSRDRLTIWYDDGQGTLNFVKTE
jgi:heat shock protein HslJ